MGRAKPAQYLVELADAELVIFRLGKAGELPPGERGDVLRDRPREVVVLVFLVFLVFLVVVVVLGRCCRQFSRSNSAASR
jgi:hypothetical protein